eukprot:Selendium_serpulae@DN6159_c2_g1_i10.p2
MNELELQTGRRKAIPIEEALRTTKELLKLGHIKPQIVKEIYNHWIDRRQKLGKPLLRKFAPVAAPNDNGPFAVFRPRPKDRMILRRPRRNATDSIPKLNRLAEDFRHVDHLLCKIRARDEVKQRQIDKEDDPLCFRFFLSRHTNEAGQIDDASQAARHVAHFSANACWNTCAEVSRGGQVHSCQTGKHTAFPGRRGCCGE